LLKKRLDGMGCQQAVDAGLFRKKIDQHGPDLFVVFNNA